MTQIWCFARTLKNRQLTSRNIPAISGTGH
jgi:hypothetical protein